MGKKLSKAFYPKSVWQKQEVDILDPIFFIMIFLFVITITANFIYIGDITYGDIANRSVTLIVLALAGLTSKMYLDQTVKKTKGPLFNSAFVSLDNMSIQTIFTWLIIGLVGLIILNLFFGTNVSGSFLLPYFIFGTVGAVGEELFFLSMQAVSINIIGFSKSINKIPLAKDIIVILLITGLFTFFHTVVYSGEFSALAYVTGLRIICSIQYQVTRRLSIPILTHLINNMFAISGVLAGFGGIIFA